MNISANQRFLNILQNAISNGFEFDETDSFENIIIEAMDYLDDTEEGIDEECQISVSGDSQYIIYDDGMGYEYVCSGDIVDWSGRAPGEKVHHTTVFNSKGEKINLYTINKL